MNPRKLLARSVVASHRGDERWLGGYGEAREGRYVMEAHMAGMTCGEGCRPTTSACE